MKRVVTGINEQGRSYIVSIDELDTTQPHNVWDFEPDQVLKSIEGIDPAATADWIGPTVGGGARWIYAPMKPESEAAHVKMDGIDDDGFHTTRTVDFDFIADGELTMVLDEDRITLQKGDFVIQQATRHAWKNESDKVAILLALIHRPGGVV
jgi:mannose-6-phosphate isomerase-like protein (cupin superfamily)